MGFSHKPWDPARRRTAALVTIVASLGLHATACVGDWRMTANNESDAVFLVRLEDGQARRVFTLPAHASVALEEGSGAFVGTVQVLTSNCQVVTEAQPKAQYVVISIDSAEKASVLANDEPVPGLAPTGRAKRAARC